LTPLHLRAAQTASLSFRGLGGTRPGARPAWTRPWLRPGSRAARPV